MPSSASYAIHRAYANFGTLLPICDRSKIGFLHFVSSRHVDAPIRDFPGAWTRVPPCDESSIAR